MRIGKVKYHNLKILLDSSTITTVIYGSFIPKARCKNITTNNWDTRGGLFQTQDKATVAFQLP